MLALIYMSRVRARLHVYDREYIFERNIVSRPQSVRSKTVLKIGSEV